MSDLGPEGENDAGTAESDDEWTDVSSSDEVDERQLAQWALYISQALAGFTGVQRHEGLMTLMRGLVQNPSHPINDLLEANPVKNTGIVRNILGPFYVNLVSEAVKKAGKFSLHLAIPSHRQEDQERLGVALQCANFLKEKIQTISLGLHEIESLSAQHLFEGVERVLDLLHLQWNNLLAVSVSGDRLEKAARIQLLALLRERNAAIVAIPRLCRVLSTSITWSVTTYWGEQFLTVVRSFYHFFLRTSDGLGYEVDFCDRKESLPKKVRREVSELKKPIITKDGYVYKCMEMLVKRRVDFWVYFQSDEYDRRGDPKDHEQYDEIWKFLADDDNNCHMLFLHEALKDTAEAVQLVENNQLSIFDLGRTVKEIISGLMKQVVPSDLRGNVEYPGSIHEFTHYDPEDGRFYREEEAQEEMVRGKALKSLEFVLENTTIDKFLLEQETIMRAFKKSPEFKFLRLGILWRCRKVVLHLIKNLQEEFGDVLDLLESLEVVKPAVVLSPSLPENLKEKIQAIAETMYGPFVDPDFMHKVTDEFVALHDNRSRFDVEAVSAQKPDKFWFQVLEVMGETLEVLPKLALDVLSLPHCGGSAEFVLNLLEVCQMRLDHADHRMSLLMLNAELVHLAAHKFVKGRGCSFPADEPFPDELVDQYLRDVHALTLTSAQANMGLLPTANPEDAAAGVPAINAPWVEITLVFAEQNLTRAVASPGILTDKELHKREMLMLLLDENVGQRWEGLSEVEEKDQRSAGESDDEEKSKSDDEGEEEDERSTKESDDEEEEHSEESISDDEVEAFVLSFQRRVGSVDDGEDSDPPAEDASS